MSPCKMTSPSSPFWRERAAGYWPRQMLMGTGIFSAAAIGRYASRHTLKLAGHCHGVRNVSLYFFSDKHV
jgi:hypothetical protein